jgi:hypothetical protein
VVFFISMNPVNFGSGSALLGGADPVVEAMKSRGMDTSVLQQQSPASYGFDPSVNMPQIQGPSAPQGAPQGNMGGPTQGAQMPQPAPESEIIIKALIERLKMDSDMKKSQLGGI